MKKSLTGIVLGVSALGIAVTSLILQRKESALETPFTAPAPIKADNLNADLPGIIDEHNRRYPDATHIVTQRLNQHNNRVITDENPFWIYTTLPHFQDLYGHNILVKSSASWCVPCEEQEPAYKSIIQRAQKHGVDLEGLVVNADDAISRNIGGEESVPWYFVMKWNPEKNTWEQQGNAYNLSDIPLAISDYFLPLTNSSKGSLTHNGNSHTMELVPGRDHDSALILRILKEDSNRLLLYEALPGTMQNAFYVSFDLSDPIQFAEAMRGVIHYTPHSSFAYREQFSREFENLKPEFNGIDNAPYSAPSESVYNQTMDRLGVSPDDTEAYTLKSTFGRITGSDN